MITLKEVKEHPEVNILIRKADEHLGEMGFTEHGLRHANLVASIAENVLRHLDFPERMRELAAIAGYLHDIGNVVGRNNHNFMSALLARDILKDLGTAYEDIAIVIGAIGNHDENTGEPVNPVAAALIIADKSDVHRTRVRNTDVATFDIHDRVNYAANHSFVHVDADKQKIALILEIDTEICPVMEYFEIFLTRMIMCRRAAEALGCTFGLKINGTKLL